MRVCIILALFFLYKPSQCQQSNSRTQTSTVDIKGNQNTISVYQGGNINVYNLSKSEDTGRLFSFLRSVPGLRKEFNLIAANTSETLELVKKATDSGYFSRNEFKKIVEEYVEENHRLKEENDKLKNLTTDPDYKKALEEAGEKLAIYDNNGYRLILQDFKNNAKNALKRRIHELADACYLQAKNYSNAFVYDSAILRINEAILYDTLNLDYLLFESQVMISQHRNSESIQVLSAKLNYFSKDSLYVKALLQIGEAYFLKARYDSSIIYDDTALQRSKEIKDSLLVASSSLKLGKTLVTQGNYEKGLEIYKAGIGYCLSLEEERMEFYNEIGLVYFEKYKFDEAISYLNKTRTYCEAKYGLESEAMANIYNNIAMVYMRRGVCDSALSLYRRALVAYRKKNIDSLELALGLCNSGSAYLCANILDTAIACFTEALHIRNHILGEEHPSVGNSYLNLCAVYLALDSAALASEYGFKAVTIYRKAKGMRHPNTVMSYMNLIYARFMAQDYVDVIKKFNEIAPYVDIESDKETLGLAQLYERVCLSYSLYLQTDSSIKYGQKATAVFSSINMEKLGADTYITLGKCYFEKADYKKSADFYSKALGVRKTNDSSSFWYDVRAGLAASYIAQGHIQDAVFLLNGLSSKINLHDFSLQLNNSAPNKLPHIAINFYLGALAVMGLSNAAESDPMWLFYNMNIGQTYCLIHNSIKAKTYFDKALYYSKYTKSQSLIDELNKSIKDCSTTNKANDKK